MLVKFVRVPADDPSRCQGISKNGQCPFRAVGTYDPRTKVWDGPKGCPRHAGQRGLTLESRANVKQYQLAKWEDRIQNQKDHPEIKSLRSEIGITRMLLETRLEKCRDPDELLMSAHSISELVRTLEKLISTCHRVELELGQLLDKSQAILFIRSVANIIGTYVDDPDIMSMLSEDLTELVENQFLPKNGNPNDLGGNNLGNNPQNGQNLSKMIPNNVT